MRSFYVILCTFQILDKVLVRLYGLKSNREARTSPVPSLPPSLGRLDSDKPDWMAALTCAGWRRPQVR